MGTTTAREQPHRDRALRLAVRALERIEGLLQKDLRFPRAWNALQISRAALRRLRGSGVI